jgi:hypothetical protein
MQLKRIILWTSIAMLVLEFICFILAQTQTSEPEDPMLGNLEYVPYMLAAMTLAFIAFFTALFAFIYLMLRSELKVSALGLSLMFMAFLLPIVFYTLLY